MRYVPVFFVGVLISIQLTGCIFIPLPPSGAQIGREDIETLKPGLSKREQVHEALGNPDVTITDRYEVFEVSEETGNVLMIGPIPGMFGTQPIDERVYHVLAEYEVDGVLRKLLWEGGWMYPSEEPLPNTNWEEPVPDISWSDPIFYGGAVSASPDGRLLAQSIKPHIGWTPAIVLRDSWTGDAIAEFDDISGCQPLGFGWNLVGQDRGRWGFTATTAFLSDSTHLVSLARDDTLCIWNAHTHKRVRGLRGGRGNWGLVTARSAPIVAAVDSNGIVRTWNGIDGSVLSAIAPCGLISYSCDELKMVLSDNGELLATLQIRWAPPRLRGPWVHHEDGYGVRLWDVETGTELAAIELTKAPRYDANSDVLALSPDHQRVAVNFGSHVEIWQVNKTPGPVWEKRDLSKGTEWSAELEQVLVLPPGILDVGDPRNSLTFSPDGRKLAAGHSSATVWEVGTWRELWRAPAALSFRQSLGSGFIFAADGRRIISGYFSWNLPESE